jgi:hypothetical protein
VTAEDSARSISLASILGSKRAAFLLVFVEHALGHSVRRPLEPPFGFRFDTVECPAKCGRIAPHLHAIDANGDNRARADIRAPPLAAVAPEFLADFEIGELQGSFARAL